ncbi:MAG: hypothetical protein M1833_004382 [Piccolia ochrophora]|nr:MAG: hypothetical protein M1833_004382 [Piccolia ochrophora]
MVLVQPFLYFSCARSCSNVVSPAQIFHAIPTWKSEQQLIMISPAKATLLAVASTAGVVQGQADFSVPSDYTSWDNENWVLSTNELIQAQYQSRISLANGYFGCALAAAGPFFEADRNLTDPEGELPVNGWPLFNPRQTFCSVAGFWNSQPNTTKTNFAWLLENGHESVISGVPHWGGIILEAGDKHLDANVPNNTISDFRSSLSAKQGIASWSYTWSPEDSDGLEFDVSYTLLVSRSRPNAAAIRADITPSGNVSGTLTDLLDGRSAERSTFVDKGLDNSSLTIYSAVSPDGLPDTTAFVISTLSFGDAQIDTSSRKESDQSWLSSNETTIGQSVDIDMQEGQTYTVFKFVGVASSDAFEDPEATARNASTFAESTGWDALVAEHQAAWEQLLPPSAVDTYIDTDGSLPDDPYVRDLQISSVLTPFYLLQNSLAGESGQALDDNSITVSGLSSDSYAGLIFWDADVFMSPGLLVANPEYARTIANYRIAKAGQAQANAGFNNFSSNALLYPWTSGRFGNCTGTGPCVNYQYHLNADIAEMLLQHRNVTGDEEWWRNEAWPVYEGVAQMFSELLSYNETTELYDIKNMTDPDEYANGVDNGAFGLASASKILSTANLFRVRYGLEVNETWDEMANNVAIPYDSSGITAEYEGMNNSVPVKQADVVLSTYPLNYQNNYTREQSQNDLAYYSDKQSPDGPAMTYSILSIVASQVSDSGCSAYTYALDAFQPYTRAPWYQFSEQQIDDVTANGGTNPAFPFLTGHGGFNQIGPFGWLGLRTDLDSLFIDPDLPPQIPQVTLRQFYFGGATLTAVLNNTHTTITRITTNNTFFNDTFASTTLPLTVGRTNPTTHSLAIDEPLTVPNRGIASRLTTPGNLLQCLPATSPDPHAPGLFPLAAVDGAISTSWQPLSPDLSSLVIDMSSIPAQPVVGLAFNWGAAPPVSAEMLFSNSSSFEGPAVVVPVDDIAISTPFDPDSVVIAPYTGNSTNVSLSNADPVYSGRYALLRIEGTQGADNETGATVAEVVVLGEEAREVVRRWVGVEGYRR